MICCYPASSSSTCWTSTGTPGRELETIVRQTAKAEDVTEEGVEPILTIRVFAVGIGVLIAPFLASIVAGLLEAGQTMIEAFIA